MADTQERLVSCLSEACVMHGFESCIVATGDGFLLASAGEDIGDEFIAHLPKWLRLGQVIGESTTQGGMLCCCMVPPNKTSLLLAWKVQDETGGELFFAAFTKRIPAKTTTVLKVISNKVVALL